MGSRTNITRVQKYQRAIEEGNHVPSMNNLALLLVVGGEGIDKDIGWACKLWQRAIEEGNHVPSMYNLAVQLVKGGQGVGKDVKQACSLWKRAIKEGNHIVSMYSLAVQLVKGGEGVEKDVGQACKLWERAVEDGNHVLSMYRLALFLEEGGEDVEKNEARSLALKRKAIEKYGINAILIYSDMLRRGVANVRRDIPRSVHILNEVAQSENVSVEVLTDLARLFLSYDLGVVRNPSYARKLLERAIRKELYVPAIHELAVLYGRGDDGVGRNYPKSLELYKLAHAKSKCSVSTSWTNRKHTTLAQACEKGEDLVEKSFRKATVRPNEVFVMVLGGAGRGKTSVVRSLQGMKFVSEHIPTELACVDRICVLANGQHVSEEEVEEVRFNSESLHASLSRKELILYPQVGEEGDLGVENCAIVKEGVCFSSFNYASIMEEEGGREESGAYGEFERWSALTIPETLNETRKRDGNYTTFNCNGAVQNSSRRSKNIREEFFWDMNVSTVPKADFFIGINLSQEKRKRHLEVVEKIRFALTDVPFPEGNGGALLVCWDLGGQKEYEMAHGLFVGPPGVKLFVIDLERFQDHSSRENEMIELCQWMNMVYRCSENVEDEHPIMVGTHMKKVENNLENVWDDILDFLMKGLGDGPYDVWVREKLDSGRFFRRRLEFIGIENSTSKEDKPGSGLEKLEGVVKRAADNILSCRETVPARWVAFIEMLEREQQKTDRIVMTKEEVEWNVEGFPAFSEIKIERERDVLEALRFYGGVGRLVVFEMRDGDYFVFTNPENILEFVRAVTGPRRSMQRGMKRRDAMMVERGLLTQEGLDIVWRKHNRRIRIFMMELLCKFDLLMRLKGDGKVGMEGETLIGMPWLLRNGASGFQWDKGNVQPEMVLASDFEDGLPQGLTGTFIPYLHRTLGGERTDVELVRSNAVLLRVGVRGRVMVTFAKEGRRVLWRLRARNFIEIARKCIEEMERFLEEPLHARRGGTKVEHKVVFSCLERPKGCGKDDCVEFEFGRWVNRVGDVDMRKLTGTCIEGECRETWELQDVMNMDEVCDAVDPECMQYDVFISHARQEKISVAYPLLQGLKKHGLTSFLDFEDVHLSPSTTREQLFRAMRRSKAAVFILSINFVIRPWPIMELKYFLDLWERAKKEGRDGPILIPLFYALQVEECKNHDLAEKYHKEFALGGAFKNKRLTEICTAMEALDELTRYAGVRNDGNLKGEEFAYMTAERIGAILKKGMAAGPSKDMIL